MTATLQATWRKLPLENVPAQLAARSSHSLTLLRGKAYIFGGELQPRTPLGAEVLALEVASGLGANATSDVQVLRPDPSSVQTWPSARVGASMTAHAASHSLLLWGGRGGKEMKAIDVRTSNAHESQCEDLWRFDVDKVEWTLLRSRANTASDFPVARSFHTMTNAEDHVYIHAGCPAQGRLATLNSFDFTTRTWSSLPDAPGPARGGTVLTPIAGVRPSDPPLLARWGGFCGHELGGPLDLFEPASRTWTSHDVPVEGKTGAEPPKRSVHGFVPYCAKRKAFIAEKEVVAVMFMGEGEGAPKSLGHDGAGKFLDDVYALLRSQDGTFSWLPLEPRPALSGETPEPRGWFAFDVQPSSEGDGIQIVLHGGLNEANERLSDAWVLQVEPSETT